MAWHFQTSHSGEYSGPFETKDEAIEAENELAEMMEDDAEGGWIFQTDNNDIVIWASDEMGNTVPADSLIGKHIDSI